VIPCLQVYYLRVCLGRLSGKTPTIAKTSNSKTKTSSLLNPYDDGDEEDIEEIDTTPRHMSYSD
jgi:hypothetical protein